MRSGTFVMAGVWTLAAGLIVPNGAASAAVGPPAAAPTEAARHADARVTITSPRAAPSPGGPVTVRGKARVTGKPLAGARIAVQYKAGGWVTLGTTKANGKGRYRTKVTLPDARRVKARAKILKPARFRGTASKPITIRTSKARCKVRNKDSKMTTSGTGAVQAAVDKAQPADRLNITGTCREHDITIDKALRLRGPGTIDAGQQGRVIHNTAALTIARGLTITGGDSTDSTDNQGFGAGIANIGGTLTLKKSRIIRNTAPYNGGGIYSDGGTVTLDGGSVTNNYSGVGGGGGIFSTGAVTMNDGSVSDNSASAGGGLLIYGTMIMNGGTISGNTSIGGGAGIYNYNHFTMNGGTISGNGNPETPDVGGGIFGISATTALNGGAITGNYGGGVYCDGGLTGNRNIVYDNTPFNIQC